MWSVHQVVWWFLSRILRAKSLSWATSDTSSDFSRWEKIHQNHLRECQWFARYPEFLLLSAEVDELEEHFLFRKMLSSYSQSFDGSYSSILSPSGNRHTRSQDSHSVYFLARPTLWCHCHSCKWSDDCCIAFIGGPCHIEIDRHLATLCPRGKPHHCFE